MTGLRRFMRGAAAAYAFVAFNACSGAGNLGNILGGVLGGTGQGNQVSGTVLGVDTRNQQIVLQASNGQQVNLSFDNQTRVVYQNQNYSVTNLERGDQVTARVQQAQNGGYYTDLVQVDQSASTSGGGGPGNVQSIQGTVQQVDLQNGLFTLNTTQYGTIVVGLPYNVSRSDLSRFQNLRRGDNVRLYGVFLNNQRVELRQFY
jgi:exosome complex RNA-binding protein Csl4